MQLTTIIEMILHLSSVIVIVIAIAAKFIIANAIISETAKFIYFF